MPATLTLARRARLQFGAVLRRLVRLRMVAAERAALRRLDAHLLDDIGLTPDAAEAELARPFWDAPDGWRR